MKIDFSHVNVISSNVEKSIQDPTIVKGKSHSKGYQLDISGIVKDNAVFNSYGKDGQGMTLNEYLQEKGVTEGSMSFTNDSASNLRRNYMAVMSNSLSTEDFAKLKEEGFHPGSMDIKDAVNVVDQIKIKLIEAGVNIKGYTDTLDSDVIEAAVGNKALAANISSKLSENDLPVTIDNVKNATEALELVNTISDTSVDGHLSEKVLKALISNSLEPTINNVFMSIYQSGQYFEQRSNTDYELISDQISKVIDKSGLEVNEENLKDAKWLYLNDLPITEESIKALKELKNISFPIDADKVLDNISDAISLGLSAKDASLITNRRVLMEIRLSMTTEANRKLLQSNFSIDTKDLEKEVEQLKALEQNYNDKNSVIDDSVSLFETTNRTISEIKELPIAVVAEFNNKTAFTISDVYEKGSALKVEYAKASESYEALRTEIRHDLGDSIKTAFRNAGDMLKEMNLSDSEANRRAVRILGYNQMEINEENISSIKNADQQINRLIHHLSPANVLRLIREGINPLTKNVDELNATLDSYNEESRDEKYSEYLVKLEHNHQISEQERESYIGIYRLIHQVEENDGAAIGTVLNAGAELSIKNLLSAVRTRKATGLDVTVNDSFGILDDLPLPENRIDVQILSSFDQADYYKKETSDLLEVLNPEKLRDMWEQGSLNASTTVDELYEKMNEPMSEAEREIENAYMQQAAEEFRNNVNSEQEVINLLNNYDIPANADNLAAMAQMLNYKGSAFKQTQDLADKIKEESYLKKTHDLYDTLRNISDEETMQEAYENIASATKAMVEKEKADSAMSAEEFRRMSLLTRQLVVMTKLSKEEMYEIPVETASGLTSVNLKIVRGSNESKVLATMNVPDIGDLVAHMLVNDDKVSGYLMAQTDEGFNFLTPVKEALDEKLDTDLSVLKKSNLEINKRLSEKNAEKNTEKVDTVRLYSIAKAFIEAVSERRDNI